MKLTEENIKQINKRLKKHGINYVDTRFELIDHFVEELKTVEGNFDDVFESYFESKKNMIHCINRASILRNFGYGLNYLLKEFFTLRFAMIYFIVAIAFYFLTAVYGRQTILDNLDILPIIIPGPITMILLYQMFYKKTLTGKSMSILGAVNSVIMFYLFLGIHVLRNIQNISWLFLFSFFISISLYDYYIYFQVRKENKKYLKFL